MKLTSRYAGIKWTDEMIETLKRKYPTELNTLLAEELDMSTRTLTRVAKKMGLEKEPGYKNRHKEYIYTKAAANRRPNRYKGKKGWTIPGSEKYQFKPGHCATPKRPVGSEQIAQGYIRVKIKQPNVWVRKQRHVWQQHHGKIPPGHNIQFKDGNPLNCDISNLYMISRADQITNENGVARYPRELRVAIMAIAKLRRTINKESKNG